MRVNGARFERGKFDGNGVVGAFVGRWVQYWGFLNGSWTCCHFLHGTTGVSNDAASTGMLPCSLSLGNAVIALIPTALKAENLVADL